MAVTRISNRCLTQSLPTLTASGRAFKPQRPLSRGRGCKSHVNPSLKREVSVRTTIETQPDTLAADSTETFNWFKHWWPVQLIYNLDTDRPNRIQLLGEYFVAWQSQSGEWVVMRDMCPHRLAPLSEGRVEEDGTLMCSYHGWRFNESGKCVKIPQADDEKSHEAACNNPRSCARTFPCKARGGILWIWPDHSETRFVDASASNIALADQYADYAEQQLKEGYMFETVVDLPYDYTVLVENLIDPSHLPFAHHGVDATARRSLGGPMWMKQIDPASPHSITSSGFTGWLGESRTVKLVDCSLVEYVTAPNVEDHSPFVLLLPNAPLSPGKSRCIVMVSPQGAISGHKKPTWKQSLLKPFAWRIHLITMKIFDGDNVLLHAQESALLRNRAENGQQASYFTPASCDLSVVQFRKWLQNRAGGGPFGIPSNEAPRLLPRRQLLDRQALHVSQCKVCQRALRFVSQTIAVCKFLSRCCLVAIGALLLHAMQHGVLAKWKIAAATVAFALFARAQKVFADQILPQFYYVDYVHADMN